MCGAGTGQGSGWTGSHCRVQKFRFDIGGYRFYAKVSLVQRIWRDILGDDLLSCKRLSRIYDKSKFFQYPLQPMDAFRGLSEAG
jgi:protoporphyrinogen oxidase